MGDESRVRVLCFHEARLREVRTRAHRLHAARLRVVASIAMPCVLLVIPAKAGIQGFTAAGL
ncbi:hypothetical protein ASD86_07815 [Lysobacter sp. Root690]|nr:hypothetical protein ASD86_07815 [Lysobacter sp. Root690]